MFPKFDLGKNSSMCPPEQNALKSNFDGAKGNKWTRLKHWNNLYMSHCSLYGVTCNEAGFTTKLNLHSNGLSGTLSESIANLTSIEVLDLSDNDIKVRFLLLFSWYSPRASLTQYEKHSCSFLLARARSPRRLDSSRT